MKHDKAVELTNSHRMDNPSFEQDDVITIICFADYASTFEIPNHDMKVCTFCNTANLEMFCLQWGRESIDIPAFAKTKKETIPTHKKNVWTNDVWHFWRPSDGTKGANACNHNHALDRLVKYYQAKFPGRTIRIVITTDGCRGQYMGRKNFAALARFAERHDNIEIVHSIATVFGGKGVWDGLGKQIKRQITDAIAEGKFICNFTIEAAIVGAMRAPKPKDAPYGQRNEEGKIVLPTVTAIDSKQEAAVDNYKYCFLAKDAAEKKSAEETIASWKTTYPDQPFELEVLLAPEDKRDYKTINNSSKHFHFSARGMQKDYIDYCRRACGCKPCWYRPSDQIMGYNCECPEMRGTWKRGKIVSVGSGSAVEKRSDDKKRLAWIKSWKKGTYLAMQRIGGAGTHEQMETRSYSLTYVWQRAVKAKKAMAATLIHEQIFKNQWYTVVSDLETENEDDQTWKKEVDVVKYPKTRIPWDQFHQVDDIKMKDMGQDELQVNMDSHSELQSLYAQSLCDDE